MRKIKGIEIFLIAVLTVFVSVAGSNAAMMIGDPGMVNGPGMGGGGMMTGVPLKNSGGMGMMGGTDGSPVIGVDGTAYLTTFNPTAPAGTAPSASSFSSRLIAIQIAGTQTSINLRGILSKPVISGTTLIGTASLPDFTNYTLINNYGSNPINKQSVLYFLDLPLTSNSKPEAVALDGRFASAPVISNSLIYVVTTDFGRAMMQGNSSFQRMFAGYNFNSSTAESYLYILNLDGTLVSKTVIE